MCGCSGFSDFNRPTILSLSEKTQQPGAGIAGAAGVVGVVPSYSDFKRTPSRVLPKRDICCCTGPTWTDKWGNTQGGGECCGKCRKGLPAGCKKECTSAAVAPSGGYSNYGGYGFWCNEECARKKEETAQAKCETIYETQGADAYNACYNAEIKKQKSGKAGDIFGLFERIGLFGPRDGGADADVGAGGPYPDDDKKDYTWLWVTGIGLVVVGGTWFAISRANKGA